MNEVWLHLQAPLAAFRPMQAGKWRSTSPTMPPSAAWGFALNLAGIETRMVESESATWTRPDAPPLYLALGEIRPAGRAVLLQQLHSYPITKKEKGVPRPWYKNAIEPIQREILVGLDMILGVWTPDAQILDRIRSGLAGKLDGPRYGLPFAGDNNFLFDRIDVVPQPPPTHWYTRMGRADRPRRGSCRLAIDINREDNSRTTIGIFAPTETATTSPPENAWTWTPREV